MDTIGRLSSGTEKAMELHYRGALLDAAVSVVRALGQHHADALSIPSMQVLTAASAFLVTEMGAMKTWGDTDDAAET
jgi:hypothetical protein